MELIYQLFTMPSLGMKQACKDKKLPLAFTIVFLAVLSNRIGTLLLTSPGIISIDKFISGLVISLFTELIVTLLILFCLTAIFHLIIEFNGNIIGKGSTLYTVFSLALIPCWMLTPLAIILKSVGKEGFFVIIPLWIVTLGWITFLLAVALKETYDFSWGKTIAILFLVPAATSILLITIGLLFLGTLFLNLSDISFKLFSMVN